jgi:hypothetical protein
MYRYDSFLLRLWLLSDGSRRIVVEHVQSGEQVLVRSYTDMAAWIDACVSTDQPAVSPGEARPSDDHR